MTPLYPKPRLMPYCLLCCAFFISQTGFANRKRTPLYAPLPVYTHVAGVGDIYGAALVAKDIMATDIDFVVGKTLGKLEAEFAVLNGIHLIPERLIIGAAQGKISQVSMESTYVRGIAEDRAFLQKSRAKGSGFFAKLVFFDEKLTFNYSFGSGNFDFAGFSEIEGSAIPLPGAKSVGFALASHKIGVTGHLTDSIKNPQSGTRLDLSFANTSYSKSALSDIGIVDSAITHYIPLPAKLNLSFRLARSDAMVTKKSKTGIETIEEDLGIDCSDPDFAYGQTSCQRLKDEVVEYTNQNNKLGTANALGGAKTLRSYRENRFRAAHAQFLGTELRWDAYKTAKWHAQIAAFVDLGWANDLEKELFDKMAESYGLGIRGGVGDLALRLDAASGSEGSQYHFTVGMPW